MWGPGDDQAAEEELKRENIVSFPEEKDLVCGRVRTNKIRASLETGWRGDWCRGRRGGNVVILWIENL